MGDQLSAIKSLNLVLESVFPVILPAGNAWMNLKDIFPG
jgi:hypothetical protein